MSICRDNPTPSFVRTVTLSGQSAGASIALQHLFSFSSQTSGAAVLAGSPYGCGVQTLHGITCYYGGLDDNTSIRYVERRHKQNLIDDPVHLKNTKIVLFSGKRDFVVLPNVMKAVERQLNHFVDPSNIISFYNTSASHVWPTDKGLCPCGACIWQNASGWARRPCCNVNNCELDFSGKMLMHLYSKEVKPRTRAITRNIRWVDQWRYLPAIAGNGTGSTMLRWAPVYVPKGCQHDVDKCHVHVNYHGCTNKPKSSSMASWWERLLWVHNIGLNEYAEANDLVIVYPQAAGSDDVGEGCFNWASYEDDPLFDTRLGVQLNTVVDLLNDLKRALNHTWWGSDGEVVLDEYLAPPFE